MIHPLSLGQHVPGGTSAPKDYAPEAYNGFGMLQMWVILAHKSRHRNSSFVALIPKPLQQTLISTPDRLTATLISPGPICDLGYIRLLSPKHLESFSRKARPHRSLAQPEQEPLEKPKSG